jgi:hypothetical protein
VTQTTTQTKDIQLEITLAHTETIANDYTRNKEEEDNHIGYATAVGAMGKITCNERCIHVQIQRHR